MTFKRYVDDCFVLTKNESTAKELHDLLNSQNPNIKFKIELPKNGNQLSLLDLTITTESDDVKFDFYKKIVKKDIFINYKSNISNSTKMAIVRNERDRIKSHCSNPNTANFHLKQFEETLKVNDFPETFIQSSRRTKKMKHTEKKKDNKDKCYLKLPFISEKVNYQIKKVFQREDLNIGLAQKSYTLRNALKNHTKYETKCQLTSCPIQNNELCFKKNVIYKISCLKCKNAYIGSTIRT